MNASAVFLWIILFSACMVVGAIVIGGIILVLQLWFGVALGEPGYALFGAAVGIAGVVTQLIFSTLDQD